MKFRSRNGAIFSLSEKKAHLEGAQNEVERIRSGIADLEKADRSANHELEIILSRAETFDTSSRDTRRSVIAMLIDRIVVHANYHLDIHFRITAQQYLGKAS